LIHIVILRLQVGAEACSLVLWNVRFRDAAAMRKKLTRSSAFNFWTVIGPHKRLCCLWRL
jgi:hypothetical protein